MLEVPTLDTDVKEKLGWNHVGSESASGKGAFNGSGSPFSPFFTHLLFQPLHQGSGGFFFIVSRYRGNSIFYC